MNDDDGCFFCTLSLCHRFSIYSKVKVTTTLNAKRDEESSKVNAELLGYAVLYISPTVYLISHSLYPSPSSSPQLLFF
ncbi:hypothetical protein YC2023_063128 [Brassica napus]